MYEINSAASKAVLFLLKNQKYVKDYINQTLIGKSFFEKELKKIKIPFLKTYANFIHIKLSTKKNRIEAELKKRKILTRKGPGVIGYEDYLRITLGPKNEMKKVITVLNKYFK
jgi:histidinol-phosphate/aromatic aminotransferase/cobyric acid decarboxylase-like protein